MQKMTPRTVDYVDQRSDVCIARSSLVNGFSAVIVHSALLLLVCFVFVFFYLVVLVFFLLFCPRDNNADFVFWGRQRRGSG